MWFLKKVQQGKIKTKLPKFDSWDIVLIEIYSICVKDNGISLMDLKIYFENLKIKDRKLFYETSVILSTVYNRLKNYKE